MFQKTIINLFLIIILILFGYVLGVYFGPPRHTPIEEGVLNDSIIVKDDLKRVDSLERVISEYREVNTRLRDSIQDIIAIRIVEVDVVQKLPLDSSVIFLKQKLREFKNR